MVIWSIKYERDGSFGNGKPCSHCRNILIRHGFKYVVYSTENGDLVKELLNDLDCRLSSGYIGLYSDN